jgi:hypothetical protein
MDWLKITNSYSEDSVSETNMMVKVFVSFFFLENILFPGLA